MAKARELPEPPPFLDSLTSFERIDINGEVIKDGDWGRTRQYRLPRPPTDDELKGLVNYFNAYVVALGQPAPPERLKARVHAVLEHYYVPDRDPRVETAIGQDWADLCGHLSWPVITATAQEWLRTRTRRPTIAEFLDLAEEQYLVLAHRGALLETVLHLADCENHRCRPLETPLMEAEARQRRKASARAIKAGSAPIAGGLV